MTPGPVRSGPARPSFIARGGVFFASILLWRYVFVSSAVFCAAVPFEIYRATSRGVAVRVELFAVLFSGCHEVELFCVPRAYDI